MLYGVRPQLQLDLVPRQLQGPGRNTVRARVVPVSDAAARRAPREPALLRQEHAPRIAPARPAFITRSAAAVADARRLGDHDRGRARGRARGRDRGGETVPDPVLVDGADAPLREPGRRLQGVFSDRVIACRLCYRFGRPKRGQIVVFNARPRPALRCGRRYIKRLIGLPGDTVHEDGRATSGSTASGSTSPT